MHHRNAPEVLIGLTVVVLLLVGCGSQQAVPPATSTAAPPEATSTPIPAPPTDTPIPPTPTTTPIPATPTATPIPPTPTPDFCAYAPEIARLFEAHRATTSLGSFELSRVETDVSSVGSKGAFNISVASGSTLTTTMRCIQGDTANIAAEHTLISTEGYTITAETRFVDGVLYFQGQREVAEDDAEDLEPMPEGWVIIEDPADWPALSLLSLDRYFGEQNPLALFDEATGIWLFEPDQASVERGAADDGTPADLIKITWSGDALDTRLGQNAIDLGFSVTDDSKIEVLAAVDDEGRLILYTWSAYENATRTDQYKNYFWITSTGLRVAGLTDIDASIEPVSAP